MVGTVISLGALAVEKSRQPLLHHQQTGSTFLRSSHRESSCELFLIILTNSAPSSSLPQVTRALEITGSRGGRSRAQGLGASSVLLPIVHKPASKARTDQ